MRFSTWLRTAGWVLLLVIAIPVAVRAAPIGQEGEEISADVLWVVLTPLIAIATLVERILEIFWDRWETPGVWPNRKGILDPSDQAYVRSKRAWSQWLGTLIAALIIGLTNVRMFRLLGFDVLFSQLLLFTSNIGGIFDQFTVGTLIDWLLTAGIIGWGGTELVHNIIEGLIKGRNLWKEMREVEAGRKSILDARFFNDYVAPELEKRGISVLSLRRLFQTLASVGLAPEPLLASLTTGQVDRLLAQLSSRPETAPAAEAIRTFLEGIPPEKQPEIPNLLALLTPVQRRQFLGA
ncbi:MAG: hypothetical protein RML46_01435 [Anaerolineae bacterium]|nr:hypothetical protein [Anaerolineae bacterium]